MAIRVILLMMAFLAAACGRFRDPPVAPLLSIADGTYQANLGGACLTLSFGRRDSYALDANCDGEAEFRTDDVVIEESVIRAGAAQMAVRAVGAQSFSGLWTEGETSAEVRFERVVN